MNKTGLLQALAALPTQRLDTATTQRLLALRQLRRTGEPDVLQELLRLFEEDSESRLQRLERASDEKTVSSTAHALKGAAANLGAVRLAAMAHAIERAAADYNAEVHGVLVEEYALSRVALRAVLS